MFEKTQEKIDNFNSLSANKIQEKNLIEKQQVIANLERKIQEMCKEHKDEKTKIIQNFESVKFELKKEIESIRSDKIAIEIQMVKLQTVVEEQEKGKDLTIKTFEKQLNDKDVEIKELKDRFHATLYDKSGGEWSKVGTENTKFITRNNENSNYEDNIIATENRFEPLIHEREESPRLVEVAKKIENVNSEEKKSETSLTDVKQNRLKEKVVEQDHCDPTNADSKLKVKDKADVLLIHDSICHDIDIKQLLSGSDKTGKKITAYTIKRRRRLYSRLKK